MEWTLPQPLSPEISALLNSLTCIIDKKQKKIVLLPTENIH